MGEDWVGYQWLAEEMGIRTVQPFPVRSQIGLSRDSATSENGQIETYRPSARPNSNLAGHLAFALKHEGVALEFLARLFGAIEPRELETWIHREPSGMFARRAGFLFEWLTSKQLDVEVLRSGNYVSALPDEAYMTRSKPIQNQKWRVRDNMPGSPSYCPTVRRTPKLIGYEEYDCHQQLEDLKSDFGEDVLARGAVWLTVKESRASFQIEHEDSRSDRVRRFAAVMERRTGAAGDPLDHENLAIIQAEILGKSASRLGLRRSPVFIGEISPSGEVVHYIAPHWSQVSALLDGLKEFSSATAGRSPIIRAAVMSFGFVFIHPMADGNGRISRFLVNDALRRDGATTAPYIIPVSATIAQSASNRAAYDRILAAYSGPLMEHFAGDYAFGETIECEDGVKTNFRFTGYEMARPFWAFPDLTAQAEYLADVVANTIEVEMRQESKFLRDRARVRARVKEVFEAPDIEIDRVIRSVQENQGISGKLLSEFPAFNDVNVAEAVISAVLDDFN